MDSLMELPRDEWPQLRDEFEKYGLFGIPGYYLLETHISKANLGSICNFRVFCPYGDFSSGFVASSTKVNLFILFKRKYLF